MANSFALLARRGLGEAISSAVRMGDNQSEFRAGVCRFEDELFEDYPAGHTRLNLPAAEALIAEIFGALGRMPPFLDLVPGFTDPRVGGFADIANHRIAIERGYLYRFLILHESAHLLAPGDVRHGPAFTYVLQLLYRSFVGIPEGAVRRLLLKHGLPSYTGDSVLIAA
jgi:hypothetical protein